MAAAPSPTSTRWPHSDRDPKWLEGGRQEMEVNFLGTFAVTQAFAPVLAKNGGGAIANLNSVASFRSESEVARGRTTGDGSELPRDLRGHTGLRASTCEEWRRRHRQPQLGGLIRQFPDSRRVQRLEGRDALAHAGHARDAAGAEHAGVWRVSRPD